MSKEREYELITILQDGEGVSKTKEKLSDLLKRHEATVVKEDEWGRRRLVPPIKYEQNGYFLFQNLKLDPNRVKEITHELDIDQNVLRYMVKVLS